MPRPDGTVTIRLDKQRNLRLDFNALVTAEEMTGKNWLLNDAWTSVSARDMRTLIYLGLRAAGDENITEEDVGSWMHFGQAEYLAGILAGMYGASMPEKDAGDPAVEAGEDRPFAGETPGPSPGTTSNSPSPTSGG